MPEPGSLALYVAATLALLIAPGPSVLYVVALSLRQGRTAGLASVVGVGSGSLVHVGAAALGLSAILASSATAFAVVKWAGAAYLVVLGVRTWLERDPGPSAPAPPRASLRRIAAQGVVAAAGHQAVPAD